MARMQVTSTTRICTFFVLLGLKFQALLFYEKIHAFSPSFPTFVTDNAFGTRKCFDRSRHRLAAEGSNNFGTQNDTHAEQEDASAPPLPIRYDPSRVRYRCRISYDGTSFAGFQLQGGRTGGTKTTEATTNKKESDTSSMTKKEKKQKRNNEKNNNPRTIQGELEKVLSRRFQRLVKVVGAGRTDGGVHSRGQAIHFDLYHNETNAKPNNNSSSSFEKNLEVTMNRMLPVDIRAWNLGPVSPTQLTDTGSKYTPPGLYNWNAMRTSTSKLYSYRLCLGDAMNPLERHQRWQLPWLEVDADRLGRILRHFEGRHDFVCFAGALEQQEKKTGVAIGTVRTIRKINLVQEAANPSNKFCVNDQNTMGGDTTQQYYRIDIYLDGALYKMVRNIVGTAIDVCRGWLDEETMLDLLHRPAELKYTRKNNPSRPAPSHGLTLERVFYPDDTNF